MKCSRWPALGRTPLRECWRMSSPGFIFSVCRRTHITLKEAIRQHLTRERSGACFVERPLCLSRCRDMYSPTNTREKRVILRYPICHHILAFSSHDSAFEPAQNACSRFFQNAWHIHKEMREIKERIKPRYSCSRYRAILEWQSQSTESAWHRGTFYVRHVNNRVE